MNSSSSIRTYTRMLNQITLHHDAQCWLVEVIAKESQDIPWTCTIDGEKMLHNRIRRISIDIFYEKVTGNPHAFSQLCKALPIVLSDVIQQESEQIIKNTVIDDIQAQNQYSILNFLYTLAFRKYQGFDFFSLHKGNL